MEGAYKILVAEDEQDIGRLIEFTLGRQGYEVELVADGQAAVDAVKHSNYDLILLDVMMPIMDGYRAAEMIREVTAETPIVFLSAKAQKAEIDRGFKTGALEYICKPFNPRELALKVSEILGVDGA